MMGKGVFGKANTKRSFVLLFFFDWEGGKWCGRGWDYEKGGNSKTSHTLGPILSFFAPISEKGRRTRTKKGGKEERNEENERTKIQQKKEGEQTKTKKKKKSKRRKKKKEKRKGKGKKKKKNEKTNRMKKKRAKEKEQKERKQNKKGR